MCCGVFGDLKPISDEMKRSFQSVHPICTNCSTQGNKERTRGPKFAGTKRTASYSSKSLYINTICVFGRALSGNPMRKLQYICMLCFFLENLQNSMSEVDEKQEIKLQWPYI